MKHLNDYIVECLNINEEDSETLKRLEKKLNKVEKDAKDAQKHADDAEKRAKDAEKDANKADKTITSEEDFKKYAENKFKKVFGDKLDTDKMNSVIDGLLDKYKEDVEKGTFGKLIGVLNKSFGH